MPAFFTSQVLNACYRRSRMFDLRMTFPRGPRGLPDCRLAGAMLAGAVLISRPATAGRGSVQVLVGFRSPAYVLSSAARASILSRSRERLRITGLRGRVGRQFMRADAVVATVPAEVVDALRRDPTVAYVE